MSRTDSIPERGRMAQIFEKLFALLPGLSLVAAISAAAYAARHLPGLSSFSPMIIAIALAMVIRNTVGLPARAGPGVVFAMRRVLRFAVILLGLQLTLADVLGLGGAGFLVVALSLVATFAFTVWLGARIGVDRSLAELIASGTSICGASAVVAANSVSRASQADVAYAIACVTVFGSIAMFVYPLLPTVLGLDADGYGIWAGASIHEIAQVAAAGFQAGPEAGEAATVAKLSRVMLLAPMVLGLGLMVRRRARKNGGSEATGGVPIPWFVAGFVAMVVLASVVDIPVPVREGANLVTTALLTLALAAMGLETDIASLRARGPRPFILGAAASLFIAMVSLLLIYLVAG